MGVQLQLAYPELYQIGLRAINSRTFPSAFEEKIAR